MEAEPLRERIARTGGYPVAGVHRGGAAHIGPENTLEAFRRSVALGSRLLELDVRLTRDNQPVLLHDCSLGRTTEGEGFVWDATLEEVQALDAAYHHPTLRGTGVRVPTLQQFLDEFVPNERLLFMLDFKDSDSVMVALPLVRHIQHRLILGSVFRPANEVLLRERGVSTPVCTDTKAGFHIIGLHAMGLLPYHALHHDIFGFILRKETRRFWTRDLVDALRDRGMQILVCGSELDRPEVLRECIEWGCEFILTDSPDVLAQVLDEIPVANVVSVTSENK